MDKKAHHELGFTPYAIAAAAFGMLLILIKTAGKKIFIVNKSTKNMDRWGIGPRFAVISLAYSIILAAINYFLVELFLHENRALFFTGLALLVLGIIYMILSSIQLHGRFNTGKLETRYCYAIVRNPIYSSWIVLTVPGLVLLTRAVLGFTIPIFMYFVFRRMIRVEEKYLTKKYGKEYVKYKERVGSILPKIRF